MDNPNELLISELTKTGYLKTLEIIKVFKKIKREDFVPPNLKNQAYINEPLPIGEGQTISQPLTVAFMLELLRPEKGQKILDIGAGSGWQTCLLAELVGKTGKIYAIERIGELCDFGKNNIKKYNFIKSSRVIWICSDGSGGLPGNQPFDRIAVAAEASEVPEELKKQLKIGGRLIIPIGNSLELLIKQAEDKFEIFKYPGFAFVPLITDKK